jgi:hypothetical protein
VEAAGAGAVEFAGDGTGAVEFAGALEVTGEVRVAGAVDRADEDAGLGAHVRPLAGRVRRTRVVTEVVAWARAMRARSAPSSVSW